MNPAAFESYVSFLRRTLLEPLPGMEAQLSMAPVGRFGHNYDPAPPEARCGAVLLLIFPNPGGISLPLIKRPEGFSVHSGQIALPGGGHEQPEHFPVETALRETEEEIGVPQEAVTVLGVLTPLYIPPSNYSITPVVGVLRDPSPSFRPEAREVARVIPVRVDDLIPGKETAEVRGSTGSRTAPCYRVGESIIWGATAMILSEYLVVHLEFLKA